MLTSCIYLRLKAASADQVSVVYLMLFREKGRAY